MCLLSTELNVLFLGEALLFSPDFCPTSESETYSFSTKNREVENALKISRCKWKRFFSANCWNAEEVDQDNSLFTYWAASLLENPCKCF